MTTTTHNDGESDRLLLETNHETCSKSNIQDTENGDESCLMNENESKYTDSKSSLVDKCVGADRNIIAKFLFCFVGLQTSYVMLIFLIYIYKSTLIRIVIIDIAI